MKVLNTIFHIVRKEFIQTFRDKRMLVPIFIAPIVQLILFGYAVTTDVKNISIGILDFDQTQQSRELITKFSITEYFNLSYQVFSYKEVEHLLQKGEVEAFIIIPPEFGKNIKKMKKTSLQVIIDATDANSANIIMSYISKLVGEYSKKILINGENMEFGNIIFAPRIWYNPELKSAVYMVPGVICLILLITTIILTSLAITKEKEAGTIEQLIVSPIKTWELILGKTIPFVVIGFCDIILIVLAGKLVFNVPVRGSLLFLFGASFIFILTTLSIGLFISTVSRTQQQAMMTAFFFIVPAMLLSGIFSPIENMPRIIQYITYLNPLRYFVKLVRGILLKGNNLSILWPEVLVLLIFGIVNITLSSLRFKKHIE